MRGKIKTVENASVFIFKSCFSNFIMGEVDMSNLQIQEALNTVNQLIPLVEEAECHFKSARNWSFLDVLGGGFFVDLLKHHNLNKASDSMSEINYLMQQLSFQLGSIEIPNDYRMQLGGFLTFADFFFDGFFADAYMASKIMSSLEEVQKLKNRLYILKAKLEQM